MCNLLLTYLVALESGDAIPITQSESGDESGDGRIGGRNTDYAIAIAIGGRNTDYVQSSLNIFGGSGIIQVLILQSGDTIPIMCNLLLTYLVALA